MSTAATMRHAWIVALGLSTGLALRASESPPPVEAANYPVTWSQYFPATASPPHDVTGWAELARAFPNRVKAAAPRVDTSVNSPSATRVELHQGMDYVRVRRLPQDLAVIEGALESPLLVLDLRYIHGELDDAIELGGLLSRRPLALFVPGGEGQEPPHIRPRERRTPQQVTLVLVNRGTAGPLEAVLDALQSVGEVLLVGTQTAGDTGVFATAPNSGEWRVIAGDVRRANGTSLLDVGVTPNLFVEISREAEDAAYLALDAGTPLPDLLDAPVDKVRFDEARLLQQFDNTASTRGHLRPIAPATDESTTEVSSVAEASTAHGQTPFDRTLQRAVNTLIALEALGRLPAERQL